MRRPRSLVFSLLVVGGLVLVTAFAIGPKVRPGEPAVHVTASAVWVVYSNTTTGGADSTVVTVTGPTTQKSSFLGNITKIDSVAYPLQAEGDSIGGKVAPVPWKKGTAYPQPASASKAWGYRRPVTPPNSKTDSTRTSPVSVNLPPRGTQQFLATVYGAPAPLTWRVLRARHGDRDGEVYRPV
jgi:hypothetical protein